MVLENKTWDDERRDWMLREKVVGNRKVKHSSLRNSEKDNTFAAGFSVCNDNNLSLESTHNEILTVLLNILFCIPATVSVGLSVFLDYTQMSNLQSYIETVLTLYCVLSCGVWFI